MSVLPHYVTEDDLDRLIRLALEEDVGAGDVTTEAVIPDARRGKARFLARERGILAGCEVAERVFAAVDARIDCTWEAFDGNPVGKNAMFGTACGPARSLLTAERLVLNVLQRMSGIATATRRFVEAVQDLPTRILDTRKTVPGLRVLDKWAVRLGGGENHRIGLYDRFLIKDNHVAAAGGIAPALAAADRYRRQRNLRLNLEVEARSLQDVREILTAGRADRILLDNMVDRQEDGRPDVSRLRAAIDLIDGRLPAEASGNVTLDTVRVIAETGVAYVSCGALTHSVRALDVSLQMHLT